MSCTENCASAAAPPPAHLRRGQRGRGGNRLDHDAFQRALAQLADEQAHEEVLLLGRGAHEELAQ